jgi:hypothetical protein
MYFLFSQRIYMSRATHAQYSHLTLSKELTLCCFSLFDFLILLLLSLPYVRSQILTRGEDDLFFLLMTLWGLTGRHCLHLQPRRWRQYVSPKRWCLPTIPYGITTRKSNIVISPSIQNTVSTLLSNEAPANCFALFGPLTVTSP